MAFTKAPTQDTHDVKRIPATGSSFLVSTVPSIGLAYQPITMTYINCFPITETQWGTEEKRRVHKREGWAESAVFTGSVTTSGVRGDSLVQSYSGSNVFFAKGTAVYRANYDIFTIGTIDTQLNFGEGSGTSAINNSNVIKICFLEKGGGVSTYLMTCNEDGSTVVDTNLVSLLADGSKGLVFIDGYLFACDTTGRKIYNSTAGGVLTTWAATDFLDAEQYSDSVLWIDKHKNYLVAFGQDSIEFFYNNAVEIGSPLSRQESYSSRIGLYRGSATSGGSWVANVEDDLYFLGRSGQNAVSLYRIRDFRIEEIEGQYIQGLMAESNLGVSSITSMLFNNNPHIVVNFTNAPAWAYFIKEDVWWKVTGSDFPDVAYTLGKPFTSIYNIGSDYVPKCFFLQNDTSGEVTIRYSDMDYATSVSAVMYTETMDFGVNRYKHIARVDAIGDYGNNAISIGFNPTRNYAQTYTAFTAQNPSTIGYGNNISWYNLGGPRAFSFYVAMVGTNPSIHDALELEYTMGVS